MSASFDKAKLQKHLSESYGTSVVAIQCEHCCWALERDRDAGRCVTIEDRKSAVEHLVNTHHIWL